jgi:ribosomal protein L11 methyltransferase
MASTAVTIVVPGEDAEAWSDALIDAGASSVDVRDAAAGTEHEQPLFAEPGDEGTADRAWPRQRLVALWAAARDWRAALDCAARAIGRSRPEPERVEIVADEDWVARTQSQFEPIRVDRRLWIVPSWHVPPDPDAINLLLDPGLAFGTGSHPTTRLCLRWLLAHLAPGQSVLDYGCGSGILAIAAARLGAGSALGVDIDPDAVHAARSNAVRNAVRAEFRLPDEDPGGRFDVVVANILANPLRLLAPSLAARARIGGRLVLAGLLDEQADDVAGVYRPWFNMARYDSEEGWTALHGERLAL